MGCYNFRYQTPPMSVWADVNDVDADDVDDDIDNGVTSVIHDRYMYKSDLGFLWTWGFPE